MPQAPVHRTRLWSAEVKQADPTPEVKIDYVFGNGRVFFEPGTRRQPSQQPINAPINE